MKKIAILSMLMLTITSTSSAQDSCITRPSCADLGYTKTASQCEGKNTLKCPFDLTAVSCEEDSGDSGASPNFKKQIKMTEYVSDFYYGEYNYDLDVYFYMPLDGCVLLSCINGYMIIEDGVFREHCLDTFFQCAAKGTKIRFYTDDRTVNDIYFIPLQ